MLFSVFMCLSRELVVLLECVVLLWCRISLCVVSVVSWVFRLFLGWIVLVMVCWGRLLVFGVSGVMLKVVIVKLFSRLMMILVKVCGCWVIKVFICVKEVLMFWIWLVMFRNFVKFCSFDWCVFWVGWLVEWKVDVNLFIRIVCLYCLWCIVVNKVWVYWCYCCVKVKKIWWIKVLYSFKCCYVWILYVCKK